MIKVRKVSPHHGHACRSEALVRRLVRLEHNESRGKIFIVKECVAGEEVRGNTQDLESEGQSRGRVKGKWITLYFWREELCLHM
jgi:hypothetical protein